jgi:hypothetical protein
MRLQPAKDNGIYRPLLQESVSLTRCLVNSPLPGVEPVVPIFISCTVTLLHDSQWIWVSDMIVRQNCCR